MREPISGTRESGPGGKELPQETRLEEFVIERVLGSGGFGITYLATDLSLNRQVVIKENLPSQFAHRDTTSLTVHAGPGREDQENFRWSLENFSREGETLASLRHPGIVPVLRRFEAFGTAYFVMPYIEGSPLDVLLRERQEADQPFTETELRGLLERVLDALGYLHDRGIYHRDIKPGNILMTADGLPVLIDFGSARHGLSERSMTVIESPGYTPFEQLQSRGNVGVWSDFYALGATLIKVIVGETPPRANDRIRSDPHVRLTDRKELKWRFSDEFLSSVDRAFEQREDRRGEDAGRWKRSLFAVTDSTSVPIGIIPSCEASRDLDPSDPMTWAEAADRGNPLAKALLGDALCWGGFAAMGIVRDVTQGVCLVKESANQGHPLGLFLLSRVQRLISGHRQHPDVADRTEREALGNGVLEEGGSCGPVWWLVKSTILREGRIARRDLKKAAGLTKMSLESGYLDAWSAYGVSLMNGEGVSRDRAEGFHWLMKAADAGYGPARLELAGCYRNGNGVKKDLEKAMSWYRKAVVSGEDEALNSLGFCLRKGIGCIPDAVEAAKLYQLAADAGNPRGQHNLGFCYEEGVGFPVDKGKAVHWYSKAAALGNAKAKECLKRLGVR